jgi:hypothetical protein
MYCYVDSESRDMKSQASTAPEDGLLTGKLVHLAIPVRWSLVEQNRRGPAEMACTYDIHPRGARLLGISEVSVGDLVLVERGRNKAMCEVVWTGDPESQLRGQFTVQCVEPGKTPWDDELRQMEEQYQPVVLDSPLHRSPLNPRRGEANRRRRPRYLVEGKADVIDGLQRLQGEVQQLSEYGARMEAREPLLPGTDFRMSLNVLDVTVALKAQVKYLTGNAGMGVEFQEIRRGDRPLLDYVLRKLRLNSTEDFVKVEVVTEPLAAVAG